MNFVKFSACYDYLHSPKSWLHYQNTKGKLYTLVVYLIYLPFVSLKQIFILFIIFLFLCQSISIGKYLKDYFYKNAIVFIFFLLISIKSYDEFKEYKASQRNIWHFCIFSNSISQNTKTNKLSTLHFYIPIPVVRFISIHLIYLILIRCFLLTTSCEKIIKETIRQRDHVSYFNAKFIFTTTVSSQFIKIIFEQANISKKSYALRDIKSYEIYHLKETLIMLTYFLQQFLFNTHNSIYAITSTLYSRSINCSNLI